MHFEACLPLLSRAGFRFGLGERTHLCLHSWAILRLMLLSLRCFEPKLNKSLQFLTFKDAI